MFRAIVDLNKIASVSSLINRLDEYTDPDDWHYGSILDVRRRLDNARTSSDYHLETLLDYLGELIDTMID
jgi:hypothetical protein